MQALLFKGFTLIELVTIILLLSIIGVVAFGRLGNVSAIESKSFYDQTLNAVRYAQKLAISTGCNVQVSLSANGFNLHQGQAGCTDTANYTRDVLNPADRSRAYDEINPDITINPVGNIVFTPQSTVTGITGSQTYSVDGRTFTVFQFSGLVDAP